MNRFVFSLFVIDQLSYLNSVRSDSSAVVHRSQKQNLSLKSFQQSSFINEINQSTNVPTSSFSSNSKINYLVGNLSETFSFEVAPSSVKVAHLSLNGRSLFIIGIGFSNKSKFNYDEEHNRLTIVSLDRTTVGHYSAVDHNWNTFTNVITAINSQLKRKTKNKTNYLQNFFVFFNSILVSSFRIDNSQVSEDNNHSFPLSCSISIILSTFKLSRSSLRSNNQIFKSIEFENLPHLDLFISTRSSSSVLLNKNIYNDTLDEQNFTRTITIQRSLTRADHNETIQCQVQSNDKNQIYVIKTVFIDVQCNNNTFCCIDSNQNGISCFFLIKMDQI